MNSLLYSNDAKTSLQHYCRMLLEKKRKQVVEESIKQVADTVTIPSAPKTRVRFALPFPATAPISSDFFLTEITSIPLSGINPSPRFACNFCLGSNQSYVMAFMRVFVIAIVGGIIKCPPAPSAVHLNTVVAPLPVPRHFCSPALPYLHPSSISFPSTAN